VLPPDLQDALREVDITLPELPRSVLLVDDEPENLEVLRALLENSYEIHTARSGQEALDYFASGQLVDLIIADQRMPGMTGVDLLTQVAKQSPDTVRVVLTAYSDLQPMLDAINCGCVYRFLVKPYEPEELRATVSEALWVRHGNLLLRHLIDALSERRDALNQTLNELRETHDQLLAAERMTTIGRATSGIVHNLRNLSTIMSMLMHEIRQKADDPVLVRSTREALDGLESLLSLLERIREFARAGDTEISRVPTEMNRFLYRTVALAKMQDVSERCPMQIESDPEAGALELDPGKMQQALLALIDNAVRASPPGSPVTISFRKQQAAADSAATPDPAGEWACLEVVDQGCGMDDTTRARAFEPLFSAFSPARLGLGLEAARLAVQAHGGHVELESSPGAGTTARLLIPLGGES
jgi:signal transduction histidine kinase